MIKTDIVIVGSGPSGIFTALELIKKSSTKKVIRTVIIEVETTFSKYD